LSYFKKVRALKRLELNQKGIFELTIYRKKREISRVEKAFLIINEKDNFKEFVPI